MQYIAYVNKKNISNSSSDFKKALLYLPFTLPRKTYFNKRFELKMIIT